MEYIRAKNIVTATKSTDWFGAEYNMNIYRGCCHGCIYCDSRSDCYRVENFDAVRAKEDALSIIRSDLRSKRKTGVVSMGAMSDPYNPFEEELRLTRGALEIIGEFGFGVAIATKSGLAARDAGVLAGIGKQSAAIVKITVTTLDDRLCGIIEPNAPVSSKRFEALAELARNGVFAGILLMPLLPFINDTVQNVLGIVRRAAEVGARFIYPGFGVTLRDSQREYFYRQLVLHFPGIKEKYIEKYGNVYSCGVPDYKRLYGAFAAGCEKYGILYKMGDIVRAYKPNRQEQLYFG
jgi:DNA repair photolyase